MDDEAVRIDVIVIIIRPTDQPLPDLLRKVRRRAVADRLDGEIDLERRIPQIGDVGRRQGSVPGDLIQNQIAALGRPFRVANRIVIEGTFQHPDERGAFEDVQLTGRLAEIRARSRLDADRVVEKRHRVHVRFEDFLFRVDGLDLQRRDYFLQLAIDRYAPADLFRKQVSRQLLSDRRSPLKLPRRGAHGGAENSLKVDAGMIEEPSILDDEKGI